MSEQPLDLKRSFSVVARHKRTLACLMAIGLAAGGAYTALRPPTPTATALVLLPPTALNSSNAPMRDMKTEVVIATSLPVLSAAGQSMRPEASAEVLRQHVSVTSLSQDVLSFRAKFRSSRQALAAAAATATSYIKYAKSSSTTSADGSLTGLRSEAQQLQSQILQLQTQINTVSRRLAGEGPSSSAGQTDTALLGSLRSEQGQVSLELDTVNTQIANTQLSSGVASGSTLVLQKATLAPLPSSTSRGIEYGLLGLAGGLIAGTVFILLCWRNDPRLRLRDDISAVVGAPVISSLTSRSRLSTSDWIKILRAQQMPAVEAWSLRRMLRELGHDDFESSVRVNVLSFSKDTAALTVGPRLAEFVSHLGIPVALHVRDQPATTALRAACAVVEGKGRSDEGSLRFVLGEELPPDATEARLVVTMTVVDRAKPVLSTFGDEAFLAVSAGQVTVEELARLALAASEVKTELVAVVLVNPDPGDSSTGVPAESGGASRNIIRHSSHSHGPLASGGQR